MSIFELFRWECVRPSNKFPETSKTYYCACRSLSHLTHLCFEIARISAYERVIYSWSSSLIYRRADKLGVDNSRGASRMAYQRRSSAIRNRIWSKAFLGALDARLPVALKSMQTQANVLFLVLRLLALMWLLQSWLLITIIGIIKNTYARHNVYERKFSGCSV